MQQIFGRGGLAEVAAVSIDLFAGIYWRVQRTPSESHISIIPWVYPLESSRQRILQVRASAPVALC